MCGIWATLAAPEGEAPLRLMAHRGPDGHAHVAEQIRGQSVELGHLRLAIIDLDRRADQPMNTADGRHCIVFNGEIYNYVELRAELQALGRTFATQSDSEVLLQAWCEWGEACLPRLVGMFAFAILDRTAGEVVVARDPFGIKPLYVAQVGAGLAFSSEIPPLLSCPGVDRAGDAEAAYRYVLFGATDGTGQTLFRSVRAFPPAHLARIALGPSPRCEPRRYWSPKASASGASFGEAAGAIRDTFLDNVRLHLRSDVPLGAALSGGIDSSAIVAGMRLVGGETLDIRTFSFVSPGHDVDESHWIDMAAKAAGAQASTVSATPEELVADLDALVRLQGEPFGSTSIYAQYRVMKLARENGIKVMLDGQGSDEMFAGYRPYLAARFAEHLSASEPLRALAFLRTAATLPGTRMATVAMHGLGSLAPHWLVPLGRRLAGKPLVPDWLDGAWFSARGVRFEGPAGRSRGAALHDRLLESLTSTVLPALLRYEDRNSMAFSIESRVPFLTTGLVDLAYSCPSTFLIDDAGETKAVFRAAMRGIVPDAILDRRDKIGFATPEKAWLAQLRPWVAATLRPEALARLPFLRADQVARAVDDQLSGRTPFDFQTWRWLNLIRWAELFDVHFA